MSLQHGMKKLVPANPEPTDTAEANRVDPWNDAPSRESQSTTRPGSLAALCEAVARVGRAAGLTDDPPPPTRLGSPFAISAFALARKAHGRLVMEGGFTIDEEGNAAAGNLWAVSTEGFGKVIPGLPSVDEIHAYLRDTPLDGQWFGGWHDRVVEETHLDRTQLFGHKHTAIMVAMENNQKAIYNIETGETVNVPRRVREGYTYNCKCGMFWDASPAICEPCPNCAEICRPN